MVGKHWGITPKTMLWLYTTVVRPSLTYANIVWWPRTELYTIQNELQKFQRTATLAATGCMRTTPSAALEIILGIPPLHTFIKQEAAMSALRLQSSNQWKHNMGKHTKVLDIYEKVYPPLRWLNDKICKTHIIEKHYNINLTDEDEIEATNRSETTQIHTVYTDGSKSKEGAGAGVFCPTLNIKTNHHLGQNALALQLEHRNY